MPVTVPSGRGVHKGWKNPEGTCDKERMRFPDLTVELNVADEKHGAGGYG